MFCIVMWIYNKTDLDKVYLKLYKIVKSSTINISQRCIKSATIFLFQPM